MSNGTTGACEWEEEEEEEEEGVVGGGFVVVVLVAGVGWVRLWGGGGDEHNTGDVALHIPLPHHSQLSLNGGRVLFQFHCPLLPHEMETTTLCQWVDSDRWKL